MRNVSIAFALVFLGCVDGKDVPAAGDEPQEEIETPPELPAECGANEHRCEQGCVAEQPDDPALGCARGCGDACATPEHGVATCSGGACDFTCESPYVREGSACIAVACDSAGYTCGEYAVGGESL